ncbi:hypothetical protein M0811_05497 [Anaeramoeba ignava]|uniref:Uncharacterized protein n=1 Tax=Anaeramoeba ignava TaxID=1746090 RepID=A0A9Q0LRQ2_ANAIG|nr:hypothetical protein M0811_05497 [Anaeramoeba ignava]
MKESNVKPNSEFLILDLPIFTNERERNDQIWENQNLKIIQKYLFLARQQEMGINSGWKTQQRVTKYNRKMRLIVSWIESAISEHS